MFLTSTCCKLFEHYMLKTIITYLENNNWLYPQQHGFRSALSTVTQLVEIPDELLGTLNIKGRTGAIFLDFSKAFDVTPHQHLLRKVEAISFERKIVARIEYYLRHRKQSVTLNGSVSEDLYVYSGVP